MNQAPNFTPRYILGVFLVVGLILSSAAEIFIHRHVYFEIDGWFAFSAVYALLFCLLIFVLIAIFGFLLKREENYYQEDQDD